MLAFIDGTVHQSRVVSLASVLLWLCVSEDIVLLGVQT